MLTCVPARRAADAARARARVPALAGGLLVSLTLMGSSRKIFGPEVVQQYLVPHRVDIGVATFFSIGIAVSVQLGLLSTCEKVAGIIGPLVAGPLYASRFGPAAPAWAAALVAVAGLGRPHEQRAFRPAYGATPSTVAEMPE